MNEVKQEKELYGPMVKWLYSRLSDKYKNKKCEIECVDCHNKYLDDVLEKHGIIDEYPLIVGLQIKIDVLGIVKCPKKSEIFFIEAKITPLNLHDLGQLWAYCKLCDPSEAFLLSSAGLGSLDKVFNVLGREDLLSFGDGKIIKKMQIAKWDVGRNTIDNNSIVPKM